jgi:NAD(P)-dependent dehydrogenase (short-subunit alcohol dehydrogenase family)
MLLDGKVAVLSGVGPGLGRESALVFAREGASVVLVARDERRIAAVGREVEQAGGRAFDVNVFGTLRMTRAVAVLMAERGAGSIVMVNSIASAGTMPRIADYTGSKAALAGMTRTLARELGPHGIRVNGIHPAPCGAPTTSGGSRPWPTRTGRCSRRA